MKAFGVGCFHFGITDKMPSTFSSRQYAKEIESTLKEISNISQIMLDFDDFSDLDEQRFSHDGDIPEFSDGEDWFPYLSYLDISFEIYLPYRVQAEILEIPEQLVMTQSERFRVSIRNCYHSPVSFIAAIGADTEDCQPSNAIVLLRRYLEKEVKKQDGRLRFEFVGPSPFHADFFLRLVPDATAHTFDLSLDRRRGYDKLVFITKDDWFEDENEALEALYEELDDELALYYCIIRSHGLFYDAWANVNEHISKIMQSEQSKGPWMYARRVCTRGHELSALSDELCLFRSLLIQEKQKLDEAYRNTYASGGYLTEYVQDIFQNPPEFPVKETSDLVQFREQRHSKFWEMLTLLIAAILGGLVGGLLTYFLTVTSPGGETQKLNSHDASKAAQTYSIDEEEAQPTDPGDKQ